MPFQETITANKTKKAKGCHQASGIGQVQALCKPVKEPGSNQESIPHGRAFPQQSILAGAYPGTCVQRGPQRRRTPRHGVWRSPAESVFCLCVGRLWCAQRQPASPLDKPGLQGPGPPAPKPKTPRTSSRSPSGNPPEACPSISPWRTFLGEKAF